MKYIVLPGEAGYICFLVDRAEENIRNLATRERPILIPLSLLLPK